MDKVLNVLCVGDIILGDSAEPYFKSVLPVLEKGDLVMGQLEVPYTDRGIHTDELERHLDNLYPLKKAKFDVLTLAGNHINDEGSIGIKDTTNWLNEHGLKYVGAGMNIKEAKQPVIIKRKGIRIGILKYNCVGPEDTWANSEKAGCAYVDILTHYRLEHANPGGPPAIYTFTEPKSLHEMKEDIDKLKEKCDFLIVSFHKGLVHQPVTIAEYEKQVSYSAIDAGADLVVGEHAHLLKGIEIYKGKTIYHGLNNFVAYVPSLFPKSEDNTWASKRIELFGFSPNPDYPTYPFHPDSIYTIIASINVLNNSDIRCSFIPCIVNKDGVPMVVDRDTGGQEVFDYMENITNKAGLNATYTWEGSEIIIREKNY